jgi:lambda family phage portal protein
MSSERPDQYRGVPYLAQVIEPLLQLNRYTNAEIMAAVIQSFYSAFIKTKAGTDEYPFNETGDGDINPSGTTAENSETNHSQNTYELGPGTVNVMEPGEDVAFSSPTHPQTGFKEFTRALAEQIGAALEVPADLLLKAFDSSYSASRGALLEAWKGFKMKREWLTNDLCRPAYEIWMTEAVALGRISAPGFLTDPRMRKAWLGSEWIGPSQGQLDPVKETNAAVNAINNGLSTREAESIRLNGSKFSTNVKRLTQENKQLREAGGWMPEKDINENDGNGGNVNAE